MLFFPLHKWTSLIIRYDKCNTVRQACISCTKQWYLQCEFPNIPVSKCVTPLNNKCKFRGELLWFFVWLSFYTSFIFRMTNGVSNNNTNPGYEDSDSKSSSFGETNSKNANMLLKKKVSLIHSFIIPTFFQ